LRAATVVGEQMTVPMLVAGYGEETRSAVARRLPSLAPMGLVAGDPQGETLVFRQPLVREVAYRGLPYRIRRLVHQRIGDYLERYREEATSNWLTLLAHHTFEGQAWEKAVQSNLDLGQRAMRNYLMDQAVQAFERVLESASAGRLSTPEACFEAHHLLGDTLTILGQYDAALEHLEAARALLPAVPTEPEDILHLADLEYHIASALESQGHYDVAFEAVQRGLNLNGVQKSQEGAQLTLMGANLFFRQGHYEKAQAWASESAALAAQFPGVGAQRIRARALYQLAYIVSLRGDPHEALALGQQSLEIYQSLQDLLGEMNTRTNLLLINLNLGQWELAVEHGERGLMLARRIHHTEGEARLAANLGEVYRYQGRFKEARMAYTAALEITQERGIAYGEALMENNLAAIALREGALEEAARRLKRAEEIYQKLGSEQMLPEIYRHRGFLYLQQEATDKARLWGQRSLEVAEAQGARPEIGRTLQLLAEICIHEGKCEIARDHISKARVLLQEAQDRYGEAQAILTEARFQHHCGTRSQAITLAKEAQAHFEALGAAWDSAQAQALLESWEVGT